MQQSKTDEKMQEEGKVCRQKIEKERRKMVMERING